MRLRLPLGLLLGLLLRLLRALLWRRLRLPLLGAGCTRLLVEHLRDPLRVLEVLLDRLHLFLEHWLELVGGLLAQDVERLQLLHVRDHLLVDEARVELDSLFALKFLQSGLGELFADLLFHLQQIQSACRAPLLRNPAGRDLLLLVGSTTGARLSPLLRRLDLSAELLELLQRLGMVLDHHRGKLLDLPGGRVLGGELAEGDFHLVADRNPGGDLRISTARLSTCLARSCLGFRLCSLLSAWGSLWLPLICVPRPRIVLIACLPKGDAVRHQGEQRDTRDSEQPRSALHNFRLP